MAAVVGRWILVKTEIILVGRNQYTLIGEVAESSPKV